MRCGILLILGLAAGAFGCGTRTAEREAPARETPNDPPAQRRAEDGTTAAKLAAHPWWKKPISETEISSLIARIISLKPAEVLIVGGDGRAFLDAAPLGRPVPREYISPWVLQGQDDNNCLYIVSALLYRGSSLAPSEARSQLHDAIEAAYQSEQQFLRTGKGNSIFDRLTHQQGAEEMDKRAQRRMDEQRREFEEDRKKPMFPGMVPAP